MTNAKKYFYLALLIHLLLFLSLSLEWFFEPLLRFEKKSERYLPAYVEPEPNTAGSTASNSAKTASVKQNTLQTEEPSKTLLALKKQASQPSLAGAVSSPQQLAHSSAFIQAESLKTAKPQDEPLLKELSRATAAKLHYPPKAAAFRIRGTVIIRFLLLPDGQVREVSLVQSSGFAILDEAALHTIQAISPVRDVNLYLSKPRFLLAGIIFD